MSEFKVGQKVWVIPKNEYRIIRKISGNMVFFEVMSDMNGVFIAQIHETGDDMLLKLGYKPIKSCEDTLSYMKNDFKFNNILAKMKNQDGTIYVDIYLFIKIDPISYQKVYKNHDIGWGFASDYIAEDEHDAIHQKIIEMKARKSQ